MTTSKSIKMQTEIPYLNDDVIHIVSNKWRLEIRLLIHVEVHVLHPAHVHPSLSQSVTKSQNSANARCKPQGNNAYVSEKDFFVFL